MKFCVTRLCNAETFVKKFLDVGGKEIQAILQRLDRLTGDEARITAAQTLKVVYGLFQNMRDVVDGEQTQLGSCLVLSILPFRRQNID